MKKKVREIYSFSTTKPLILLGEKIERERKEEIRLFKSELKKYDVFLRDIVMLKPTKDMRDEILNMAIYIINDKELYSEFKKRKDINKTELSLEFSRPKEYIEKYRDYIIVYVFIFGDSKYENIRNYVNVKKKIGELKVSSEIEIVEDSVGIVLEKGVNFARIITCDGLIVSIKIKSKKIEVGELSKGNVRKGIRDYKVRLGILATIMIILLSITLVIYSNVSRVIVVKTTSPIILEVNGFNRVKFLRSNFEKGKNLIDAIDAIDRNLDSTVVEIMKYSEKNNMIPNDGLLITISGKPLKHGNLENSAEYAYEKEINITINNVGSHYKLN